MAVAPAPEDDGKVELSEEVRLVEAQVDLKDQSDESLPDIPKPRLKSATERTLRMSRYRERNVTMQRSQTVQSVLGQQMEDIETTSCRDTIERLMSAMKTQIVIAAIICLDIVAIGFAIESSMGKMSQHSVLWRKVVSISICAFYVIEIMTRAYALTPRQYFKSLYRIFDYLVVITSLTFEIIFFRRLNLYVLVLRCIRATRIVKTVQYLIESRQGSKNRIRSKRGFSRQSYDLDLCYVTEKVIAMSLPAKGLETLYRNKVKDVSKFLRANHGEHYLIFDLSVEQSYDPAFFGNKVEHFQFYNDGVPSITCINAICNSMHEWLETDDANVVALHCQAGVSCMGTITCAFLVSNYLATAHEAIAHFGQMRSTGVLFDKPAGIETRSHRRYVHYFEQYVVSEHVMPSIKSFEFECIQFGPFQAREIGDSDSFWTVEVTIRNEAYVSSEQPHLARDTQITFDDYETNLEAQSITFTELNLSVKGNVQIALLKNNVVPLCVFWFHTYFLEEGQDNVRIIKSELDILPQIDRSHRRTRPNFSAYVQGVTVVSEED